jgi:WD40 repeat protein
MAWPDWAHPEQLKRSAHATVHAGRATQTSSGTEALGQPVVSTPDTVVPTKTTAWRLKIDPDPSEQPKPIKAVSSHPNGRLIAVANGRDRAVVYDISGAYHKVAYQISEKHTRTGIPVINDIAFSFEGRLVATAVAYVIAVISDFRTGAAKAWLTDHALESGEATELVAIQHNRSVSKVAVSLATLAIPTELNSTATWDLTNVERKTHAFTHNAVTALSLSLDDPPRLATGGGDKIARIWDTASGASMQRCLHEDKVTAVAFSPDGLFLATGCADARARIWSANGTHMLEFAHDGPVTAVTFSPDGRWLGSAGEDGAARIWNVQSGLLTMECTHPDIVTSLAFGQDSDSHTCWLGTGCNDGSVRIWDIEAAPHPSECS